MSVNDKELDGYKLAHGQECWGEKFFGIKIFIRMSHRELLDEDSQILYRAADTIRKEMETVSAKLDPEGPLLRQRYRDEIAAIYEKAGITAIYMEQKPNGYCSRPCCLNRPWFRVTSSIGHILIGWRKSVISISWEDTIIDQTGEELFPNEKVTRLDRGIHAWSTDWAAEYLKKLHSAEALK